MYKVIIQVDAPTSIDVYSIIANILSNNAVQSFQIINEETGEIDIEGSNIIK